MERVFDHVVVGAGVTGCSLARLLADREKKVLLIEKRGWPAGQAYDEYDEAGILVHRYGPHLFHTPSDEVFAFLSRFTEWHTYEHRVIGEVDGALIPIPFNMRSLRTLFPGEDGARMEHKLTLKYGREKKIPVWELMGDADPDISGLGRYVYEKVFFNYTKKQWGVEPDKLDKSVTSRVPVAVTDDDRYFYDRYQCMPLEGYTAMFNRMIDHAGISFMPGTDYAGMLRLEGGSFSLLGKPFDGNVYFTAPLDELFDYRFGALQYRGLEFEFRTFEREYFQSACTVNYPNEHRYTRITEFKHCTGQRSPATTVVYEYPAECDIRRGDTPFYPVPRGENRVLYQKYKDEAKRIKGLVPAGRLAEYRYINMSEAVATALGMIS